jgi:hypothetical protein
MSSSPEPWPVLLGFLLLSSSSPFVLVSLAGISSFTFLLYRYFFLFHIHYSIVQELGIRKHKHIKWEHQAQAN